MKEKINKQRRQVLKKLYKIPTITLLGSYVTVANATPTDSNLDKICEKNPTHPLCIQS